MQKIYKYRLPRDGQVVTINDHVIDWLHVGLQDGMPTAWGVVDLDDAQKRGIKRSWDIVAWGTGWDLPDEVWIDCDYIGTCEDSYGYVWHYFAKMNVVSDNIQGETLAASSAFTMSDSQCNVTVNQDVLNLLLEMSKATELPSTTAITFACQ